MINYYILSCFINFFNNCIGLLLKYLYFYCIKYLLYVYYKKYICLSIYYNNILYKQYALRIKVIF